MSEAGWTWSYGPGASASSPGATRELADAKGRVCTWRVDGHAFAQFTIDGRSDEASGIVERRDDLWVYRDGSLLFRGRIVGAEDQIDATEHAVQFLAVDYRGMLSQAAKVTTTVPTYTGVDPAQIAWQLVQHRQAQTGGDWGITEGVGSTSGYGGRDLNTLVAGKPIGEAIDELLRREDGGEWEISPALELNRWWPQRGTVRDAVLDYGGVITRVTKSLPEFGNAAIATGNEATTPVGKVTADVGTDERGRWSIGQGFPSVKEQTTVAAKAQWLVDQASTIEHAWRATFAARRWDGPDHVWIGDTVNLRVQSGRLSIAGAHRVAELQAVCGDHGTETISVGLVGVPA